MYEVSGIVWGGNMTQAAAVLKDVDRELYFWGITILHVGVGVLVSKKVKKHA